MTNLSLVAYCRHHIAARTSHHHRAAEQHVLGIGLSCGPFGLLHLGEHPLVGEHLTSERALVNLQVYRLHESAIRRHLVTSLDKDEVAHHHLAAGYLLHFSLAHHLDQLILAHLGEHTEAAGCITLEIEAYRRSQDDGGNDADGLHEVVLNKRQT